MNKTAAIFALACTAFFLLGTWGGYIQGTKRPEVVWTIRNGQTNAYGWDKGNKCIATWTWSANGLYWERLGPRE